VSIAAIQLGSSKSDFIFSIFGILSHYSLCKQFKFTSNFKTEFVKLQTFIDNLAIKPLIVNCQFGIETVMVPQIFDNNFEFFESKIKEGEHIIKLLTSINLDFKMYKALCPTIVKMLTKLSVESRNAFKKLNLCKTSLLSLQDGSSSSIDTKDEFKNDKDQSSISGSSSSGSSNFTPLDVPYVSQYLNIENCKFSFIAGEQEDFTKLLPIEFVNDKLYVYSDKDKIFLNLLIENANNEPCFLKINSDEFFVPYAGAIFSGRHNQVLVGNSVKENNIAETAEFEFEALNIKLNATCRFAAKTEVDCISSSLLHNLTIDSAGDSADDGGYDTVDSNYANIMKIEYEKGNNRLLASNETGNFNEKNEINIQLIVLSRKQFNCTVSNCFFESNCVICYDKASNVIFYPCKHIVTCFTCGSRINKCCICNQPIHSSELVRKSN
jgi:hypothetical protein